MCRHVGTCRDVEGDSSMLHHDLRSLPRRYRPTAGQRKIKSCEQFDSRSTQLAQIDSRIWLSAELDSLDYPLFEGGHINLHTSSNAEFGGFGDESDDADNKFGVKFHALHSFK